MNNGLPETPAEIDELCINTIRTLSMDAIQKANSGHPGAPMGLAPVAYILWKYFLKHNPKNPEWIDRDRFVLSGGHASMLLYSLLYLSGYDLTLDDIKNFRQWGSKTPGHPEFGHTPGVETTTGPLGQGFSNAVGMAMAERHLATIFNRNGYDILDHYTYMLCGDGDLMEGISAEAASLAGHLGLAKLICIYDDNKISIEGSTDIAFTEDVALRFKAYNWHVIKVDDGNNLDDIRRAIKEARSETTKPSIIVLRTHIAFGSPNKQDSASAHGAPLGEEEIRLTKRNLGWDENVSFYVPEQVIKMFGECVDKGEKAESIWKEKFEEYSSKHRSLSKKLNDSLNNSLNKRWDDNLPDFSNNDGPIATRAASGKILNAIAENMPYLIGGSADLAPSNNTIIKSSHDFQKNKPDGRNIRFGVREHAMGGIISGIALHKGLRPYGGTFLVFADYMRPSIRLAGLMKLPVIYIFTHDSISVGEDGPTHQPVEQLASLRAIPGLTVIRPSDATETAEAWRFAAKNTDGPVALILSRQKLPVIDRKIYSSANNLVNGAYILSDFDGKPDVILIATGSEVHIALEAGKILEEKGISARVVSMPSWELFEKTSQEYKNKVLLPDVNIRIAVEAGIPMGWERYVGSGGAIIGINEFGASAPGNIVMEKFGFTSENIVQKATELLTGKKHGL
ncbi:MAG: transketolase [Proteobacteria bacterium]|nr:transketolase [Desulfobacteraceae bacterium]MBU3979850.1 transketolase [Pseudomonadota bacterium]MBU4013628.1 transketolase [Pseudomonadota bacterium]MBU4069085.1 transketolase [Pseudomonadota bacterium]MBU4100492.1 transketolase [Pseudomonadota bacterium]